MIRLKDTDPEILSAVIGEISRQRDILYDSDVVDACLRLLLKNEIRFEKMMSAAESSEYALVRAGG